MLQIVQSNRLEALADEMLGRWTLAAGPGAVPQAEVVIVPSQAVERWLRYRMADRFGVCANVDFRFAASFIWNAFARAIPRVLEESPFDRDVTTLALFALLAKLPGDAAYEPLRCYVGRTDEARRLELARRIADVFARYMIYRPDWLAKWDAAARAGLDPATEAWQAGLWTLLKKAIGATNLRHPSTDFFEVLERQGPAGILPPRLRIFALPSMPPMYADIIRGLARHVDVEWYSLNPCREDWADIASEKAKARLEARNDPVAGLLDVGHPLLASWGTQRREHLRALLPSIGEDGVLDHDAYVEPAGTTLLGRLQSSILTLAEPQPGAFTPAPGDRSIQVHACHSMTRQIEVLHDELLSLFDSMPGLVASDIAVYVPDLDGAAPVIDAVFGSATDPRRIPYRIQGRAQPGATPLVQAAEFLMSLPGARFDAASVVSFLENPVVMNRYDVDAAELDTIRRWLHEAGVRWGLDAAHRARLGLPADWRHTWAEALHRLTLGYAMPYRDPPLVAGVLPHGELEGSQARTLGKLAALVADLARTAEGFSQRRALRDWPAVLRARLDVSLKAGRDDLAEDQRLQEALAALEADAAVAGGDVVAGIEVLRALLEARLRQMARQPVPTGSVTFSSLLPMRGLPYRVICLLGLDGDSFPRNPPRLEFDLTAQSPRAGDRKPRDEDRGAFLDAITSAREVFYASYTGRSIRDNGAQPPSVVVSELLEYLGRFHAEGRAGVEAAVVRAHPLQPFDASYFRQGAPVSYDRDLLPAAVNLATPLESRVERRSLVPEQPLPSPPDEARRIEVEELVWFFRNPVSKYLQRLGVRLSEVRAELLPEEPFELDEIWDVRDEMLRRRLAGQPIEACIERALAGPDIPHGQWGRRQLEECAHEVEAFARQVEQQRQEAPRSHAFEARIGEFTLWGTLSGLDSHGQLGYSLRKEGANELLSWWVRHLALCIARPTGVETATRVLQADGGFRFKPVAEPGKILEDLLKHYWAGQSEPLPFFPKSAYAHANDGPDKAEKVWAGTWSDDNKGERAHPRYRLVYGGEPEAPPEGFEELANAVFGPLLQAREDLS